MADDEFVTFIASNTPMIPARISVNWCIEFFLSNTAVLVLR